MGRRRQAAAQLWQRRGGGKGPFIVQSLSKGADVLQPGLSSALHLIAEHCLDKVYHEITFRQLNQ